MKTTFDATKYISARLGDQDRTNLTHINAIVNEFVMEHLYTLCKEVIALDEVGSFPDAKNSKFHELRSLYLTAYSVDSRRSQHCGRCGDSSRGQRMVELAGAGK